MTTRSTLKLLAVVSCFALAVAASLTVLDLSTGTAAAGPAIVVRNDAPCGMAGAAADGNLILGGIGAATHMVENDNKVSLTCKGSDLANLSGSGQHFSGFLCGVVVPSTGAVVVTADSHATVSRSGQGSLTCTFDKP